MGYLYLVNSFSVLQSIELFPFAPFLPEAQHEIISSTCENAFAVLTNCYVSTELFVFAESPIFV